MKEKFIAVDSGKYNTKVAYFDEESNISKTLAFRTKTGIGYFEDDGLEKDSYIVEIDGKVYKIGNGACTEAELETSKKSDIHKTCILSAIAMCCYKETEEVEVNVAIGIPISDYNEVPKRNAFREFIFDKESYSVKIKASATSTPKEIKFKIKNKYVFPESAGALFVDTNDTIDLNGSVGVLDLGNLNNNLVVYRAGEQDKEMSLTNELGGNILINGLARKLSTEFSRVDYKTTMDILNQPANERCLPIADEALQAKSNAIIHEYLLEHCNKIKRDLDTKGWSFDYMTFIGIGGTASVLSEELSELFGDRIFIPKQPEFANVVGFLRMCYAKAGKEDKLIPMPTKMQIEESEILPEAV
ncbi:MAG: ParM/StbA family protein [Lachnospiraceae bacterium]|nr:ParM/StbA family protein [Lachnospiraceae bacterium]